MRSKRIVGFALVSVVSVGSDARAQELRGVALDQETKQPVADARVALLNRRRAELDTARTAADGAFALRATEGGKFFLQIRRSGFPAEDTDAIFLQAGETRVETLYVAPARTLERVDVIIDREVTRIFGVPSSGLAHRAIILPEDIESVRANGSARTASDVVLQKGPAFVRVFGAGSGRVCYQVRGSNCAMLYLNGQPIPSSTDIPATDLEAVAILTPMDGLVPLGRNNGVVMLFTRGNLRTPRR